MCDRNAPRPSAPTSAKLLKPSAPPVPASPPQLHPCRKSLLHILLPRPLLLNPPLRLPTPLLLLMPQTTHLQKLPHAKRYEPSTPSSASDGAQEASTQPSFPPAAHPSPGSTHKIQYFQCVNPAGESQVDPLTTTSATASPPPLPLFQGTPLPKGPSDATTPPPLPPTHHSLMSLVLADLTASRSMDVGADQIKD